MFFVSNPPEFWEIAKHTNTSGMPTGRTPRKTVFTQGLDIVRPAGSDSRSGISVDHDTTTVHG